MSNFSDVGDFHRKFELDAAPETPVCALDESTVLFRLKFMLEELREIAKGYGYKLELVDSGCQFCAIDGARQDLPKVADGLIDLVYVALGTAHLHGLPWPILWGEVQRANLSKERATSANDARSIRGHTLDVVKPVGFVPPRIIEILMTAGWRGPALPLEKE